MQRDSASDIDAGYHNLQLLISGYVTAKRHYLN